MREALRNAGMWLGAIFEPSHATRARNATIDAIVVLALGTGCALALSYGPPPLNSAVAQFAAETSSAQPDDGDHLENLVPLPEVDNQRRISAPDGAERRDPPQQPPQTGSTLKTPVTPRVEKHTVPAGLPGARITEAETRSLVEGHRLNPGHGAATNKKKARAIDASLLPDGLG